MIALEFPIRGLAVDRAVVEALGWTLVHFVWQGSIVAVALVVLNAMLSRGRAQHRYLVSCAALLLMMALPVATYVTMSVATGHSDVGTSPRLDSSSIASSSAQPAAADIARSPSRHLAPKLAPMAREPRAPSGATRPGRTDDFRRSFVPAALLPGFVTIWALGVALLSVRLLGGWWLVARLGHSTANVPLEDWQATASALARRMGVHRCVRLVRSALVSVPTAIGWLRPMILLPASTLTGLEPSQIEAIIAHELAHIRRHDYLINLLQSVIETVLFYHPAVWWVSHRIREERELCCDDLAVQTSGDAVVYARALCELERLRGEGVRMALAASGGSLAARIARLLGVSRRQDLAATGGYSWALLALILLIATATGAAVRVHRPLAVASHVGDRMQAAASFALIASKAVAEAPRSALFAATVTASIAAEQAHFDAIEAHAACDSHDEAACEAACQTQAAEGAHAACKSEASTEASEMEDAAADTPEPSSVSTPDTVSPISKRFSGEDWERLSRVGVSRKYVANLALQGFPELSIDELESLAKHGVSSAYAGAMRRALGDIGVDDLVQLTNHGVSSRYAASLREALGDLSVDDLVQLANHGISPEYVAGMRELDVDDLTPADLIHLANAGVTLEWFSALRWMGYTDLTVERAIQMRNAGITPDYASSLRMMQGRRLTLDELRTLRNQGVGVEYVATMLGLLRKDLTVDQLIRLRNQGVSVDYVAGMNALGYAKLGCDELITMHQQGVGLEFIAAMANVGYGPLAAHDLVRLRQNGVDADFVVEIREAGYGKPGISELIRMRQQGIPPRLP